MLADVMRLNTATLKQLRKEARLSVTDLAAEALIDGKPMARSHLSNIENGNRSASPQAILALAEALKVSPYALLGPEDPKAAVRELVEILGLSADDVFGEPEPVAS